MLRFPGGYWVVVLAVLTALLVIGPVSALAEPPSARAESTVLAEVRAALAKKLGVPLDRIKPETDLVKDLELDTGVVEDAVRAVFDARGVSPPPGKELTRVVDIARAVDQPGPAPAPAQQRSVRRYEAPRSRERALPAPPPVAAPPKSYVQAVYYATDRQPSAEGGPGVAFGAARSPGGQISYGRAEVNIPSIHKVGQIEESWWGQRNDSSQHIYILGLKPTDKDGFMAQIAAHGPANSDVLVYIHGFNVSFEDAINRAAQIAFDFKFAGAPIVFSWPSNGSIGSYAHDWENVTWSVQHIERFLDDIAAKANGRRVHLVAHSMGSRGLLNALMLMAYRGKAAPLFASVILCAPDFDANLFSEQIADKVRPLARHWVVYSSRKDSALSISQQLSGVLRLGTPVTVAKDYEIIDASDIEVSPWSVPQTHSYYATKKIVIDDMVKALKGLAASERGLKRVQVEAGVVWSLR